MRSSSLYLANDFSRVLSNTTGSEVLLFRVPSVNLVDCGSASPRRRRHRDEGARVCARTGWKRERKMQTFAPDVGHTSDV